MKTLQEWLVAIVDLFDRPGGHILVLVLLFAFMQDGKYREELMGALLLAMRAQTRAV
jgi:hypothetical protein